MLPNPCYDTKNKKDCPNRKTGCTKDCEQWKAYSQARNRYYNERAVTRDAASVLHSYKDREWVKRNGRMNRRRK